MFLVVDLGGRLSDGYELNISSSANLPDKRDIITTPLLSSCTVIGDVSLNYKTEIEMCYPAVQ